MWKPIETAPNNESILVHFNDGEIELIEADDNTFDWVPFDGVDETAKGVTSATHWMPLPEPPVRADIPDALHPNSDHS